MRHSSITLEAYFRKVWKLLLQRLNHSDDIRAKNICSDNSGTPHMYIHMSDCLHHRCNFISLWECLSTPNVQLSTHNVVKEVGKI